MKWILFFILLLPFANAVAVTPSYLEIEDYGELKIINTQDHEILFKITGAYEDSFVLDAFESRKIIVENEGIVTIEEMYNDKLSNAVSVSVEKEGGDYFGWSLGSALISVLVGGVYSWKKIRKRRQQRLKKEK
jgi:hypothetical protein